MADSSFFGRDITDEERGEDFGHHRLYNPFQDLKTPRHIYSHLDAQLPPQIYNISTSPELLFSEENQFNRRYWSDNLTFFTGVGYLSGSAAGATYGLFRGLREAEAGDSLKLRVTRILNNSGHAGRKFGNRAGVIGLLFAGMESGISAYRDTDDWINSVAAGLGTGAFFRAASGPRSAAVAGAIGGLMVGAAMAGRHALKRYVPI